MAAEDSVVKKVAISGFVSSLAGAALCSYFGPKVIAWYFDPPVNIGINCRSAVEWSMSRLQSVQAWGLLGGLIIGIAASTWLYARRKDD